MRGALSGLSCLYETGLPAETDMVVDRGSAVLVELGRDEQASDSVFLHGLEDDTEQLSMP